MDVIINHIQVLAPRWHKYYVVNWHYYGRQVRITFCGCSVDILCNAGNIRSKLEEHWCQIWTYMEHISTDILNHRSNTKFIIPEYPNISHHFTITLRPYDNQEGLYYWFTIKIGVDITDIYQYHDDNVMDELEAQLANLAVCAALAGSKIPVLIQYEIMAQFFGQI
jgi:hypothetical protein